MKRAKESSQFFKNKNILVAGGAGFVGTNLIIKLLKKGANIRATIHKKHPQIKNTKIEFVKADLTKAQECQKVVSGMDFVFMCAANTSGANVIEHTPLVHVTPNAIMNTLMLEAAHRAGVKKFLFISSNSVYPLTDYPVSENDVNYSLYEKYFSVGWMKLFTEKLCEMYATKIKNPMPCIIVRPGNMYGPYDDFAWETSHVLPSLIRKVVERHNPLEVWGGGHDIKDFIYVEDAVEGMLLAMEKLSQFNKVNIASGKAISIRQALTVMLKVDNFKNPNIVFNSSKPSMIPKRLISISYAKKLLEFTPKTSFHEGIQKTIQWYRQTICT